MRRIQRLTYAAVLLTGGLAICFPRGVLADDTRASLASRAPMRDRDHEIQVRVPSYVDLRNRNIVMQKHDYSCGAATLATILRYYWGDNVTEEDVLKPLIAMLTPEETKDRYKHGLAISDLRRVAVKMGYLSSIGTMSFEKLAGAKVPLIIPLKLGKHEHFVVYRGIAGGRVYLADPIRGNVRPTIAEFSASGKRTPFWSWPRKAWAHAIIRRWPSRPVKSSRARPTTRCFARYCPATPSALRIRKPLRQGSGAGSCPIPAANSGAP